MPFRGSLERSQGLGNLPTSAAEDGGWYATAFEIELVKQNRWVLRLIAMALTFAGISSDARGTPDL